MIEVIFLVSFGLVVYLIDVIILFEMLIESLDEFSLFVKFMFFFFFGNVIGVIELMYLVVWV